MKSIKYDGINITPECHVCLKYLHEGVIYHTIEWYTEFEQYEDGIDVGGRTDTKAEIKICPRCYENNGEKRIIKKLNNIAKSLEMKESIS